LIASVLGLTVADLWIVRCYWNRRSDGAPNWYADVVADPPIVHRGESEVAAILARFPQPVRMWGTYENMPTITGYAMTPTYLGLSPAEYADPALTLPEPAGTSATPAEIAAQVGWLRRAGVTHILSERPLSAADWPVEPVWTGFDPLLHRAWGRSEPLYLYSLAGSRGRASLDPRTSGTAMVMECLPQQVSVDVTATTAAVLIQTDLAYPGWTVTVDGESAEWQTVDGMYRAVEVPAGRHAVVWTYHPARVRPGAIGSAMSALVLCIGLWILRKRPAS
jgi:hypothetical protein